MFTKLDSSEYVFNMHFFNAEFEDILSRIIACYHLMLADKVRFANDENSIRDILLINYLKNITVRKQVGLTNYLFDREVPEDNTTGRTDIKIQTINTFEDTAAYYIIECKRLDSKNPLGKTGLNSLYIKNGIQRFIQNTYSSYYQTNGIIGFIVNELNIGKNITSINSLLFRDFKQISTTQILTNKVIAPNFKYCYYSAHNEGKKDIVIYHLMLDFSRNIH